MMGAQKYIQFVYLFEQRQEKQMVELGESSELGLLWQYRSLKHQLQHPSAMQGTEGEVMDRIFQVVCLLVNSFTARIEAMQLHMSELRVHLLQHEDASLIDSKYPTFTLLDVKACNALAQYFPPDREEDTNSKQVVRKEKTVPVYNLDEEDISEVQAYPWQGQVIQEPNRTTTNNQRDQSYLREEPIREYPLPRHHMSQAQDRQKKQKQRMDLQSVRDFIRQILAPQLQYNPDHKTHNIPKKVVMQLYHQWCRKSNKNLQTENSLLQMSLTNALKSAFPAIDTYTRQYRGLRFVNGFLKSEFNTAL